MKNFFHIFYILKDKVPVPCDDPTKWEKWFRNINNRLVGHTDVGALRVSTVCLGTDMRFMTKGPPILFETMIFGLLEDDYQERCCTWEEAEAMHQRGVEYAQKLVNKADALIKESKHGRIC